MRGRLIAGLAFALGLGSCTSVGLPDLSDLARDPPLPYSVLVTGGAFIDPGPTPGAPVLLSRTFRPTEPLAEAFTLADAVSVLETAAAFARLEVDQSSSADRARRARGTQVGLAADPDTRAYLDAAREAGHDYLLVIERVEDGRVEYREVNRQWPITLVAWLMIGLGALIPDHTYESHATLNAALRDVRTGATVAGFQVSGGALELSLVERADILGIALSLIVPPFWVWDDDADVEQAVRDGATGQMLAGMVRQLKSVNTRRRLERSSPGVLSLAWAEDGVRVTASLEASLSIVRCRVDGAVSRGPAFEAFERDLMASVEQRGERFHYSATLSAPEGIGRVQLLVQTVTGRVASTTMVVAQ